MNEDRKTLGDSEAGKGKHAVRQEIATSEISVGQLEM
jgi:hypothetical protein